MLPDAKATGEESFVEEEDSAEQEEAEPEKKPEKEESEQQKEPVEQEEAKPAGTAIQNLRKTTVGDTLTRDGYHLSKGLGRYVAALTWYCYITGADPEEVLFTPFEEQTKILAHHDEIVQSIRKAIQSPYECT